ncbi:phage major capsid protein [Alphaproteobacteria bacterium GH1-50]|uniref:Phage major capsid protein n=1 Tax=Kangsaoukella pontilimi TaxID=2691042 RepID=A0A7C9N0A2_9RHOB|nr:phage major capsid protein [Kangsaoukella pontilimi]MXQ08038.1 phage major capsid protein [Kangsaoukella pontilimi]
MALDITAVEDALNQVEQKLHKKYTSRIDELETEVTGLRDSMTGMQQKGFGGGLIGSTSRKSIGAEILGSDAWKDVAAKRTARAGLEIKNTILGEGGSPQDPTDTGVVPKDNMPGIVGGAFRPLRLLDVVPRGTATSNQVHYTREASWTNNAAETAEAAQKPESTLIFEGIDEPVRTIATFLKVSRQAMDDQPALQSYIDARLRHAVEQRLEQQIIQGNGSSPNLSGMNQTGNHTDLTVVTADNDFDALNRAKQQVVVSDYMPSAFLVNPADFGRLERTKTGISGDASYLAQGGNSITYLRNGMQPMTWGLPVIISNSVPSGSFFCISTDSMMLWSRQSTVVEIFDQNEDDVEKNLLTIRAEGRWAFGVWRPAAVIFGAFPDA